MLILGVWPRMVGVLVGALLLVLDDGRKQGMKWTLECDGQVMKDLESKERLSLERDAYEKLELCGYWGVPTDAET